MCDICTRSFHLKSRSVRFLRLIMLTVATADQPVAVPKANVAQVVLENEMVWAGECAVQDGRLRRACWPLLPATCAG